MATEPDCLRTVLDELDRVAPGAPMLALGQTVFWDEPMKAGIALATRRMGNSRRLVAGVHDTDYFAKLPSGPRQPGKFRPVPHNDGSTRGLWSAAAEFSTLFGAETVVTRDLLMAAGLRLARLQEARKNFVDEATEAWGWKGIVSLDEHAPVTMDVPLKQIFPELQSTFDWAVDQTLNCLNGEARDTAQKLADDLRSTMCDLAENHGQTISAYYKKLLPVMYSFAASANVDIDTAATSELLRFNTQTCGLPRFRMLDLYANQQTRHEACRCYDEAIREAPGLYELRRFGSGAIPYDLVVPGHGRGTIRLGTRGAVIMTPKPLFLSFKRPITSVRELAEAIEAKFGENCVLIGKAVALIGLLSQEYVFVFHEGASSYVKYSRKLHQLLNENLDAGLKPNPLLRARYETWDSLSVCCSWLKLPAPFLRPFGTEDLCAPSFSARWRQVGAEQEELLLKLGRLRRPVDLIRFLDETQGGSWQCLANEYNGLHDRLGKLQQDLLRLHEKRIELYRRVRELKQARLQAEKAMGDHFRRFIFEKDPTEPDLAERERLSREVDRVVHERMKCEAEMRHLRKEQNALLQDDDVKRVHERRRSIELEAELKRLRLIRHAVIASRGLSHANHRPSAWWFRLVCPDGLWFRETVDSAHYYLEPLV